MNTLAKIYDLILASNEDATVSYDNYGALEVDYTFEDIQFHVTDQLAKDGYIGIGIYAGRDFETNAPTDELELTVKTPTAAFNLIKRYAKRYAERYAD